MRESPKLAIHQYKIKSLIIKRKGKVRVREGFKERCLAVSFKEKGRDHEHRNEVILENLEKEPVLPPTMPSVQ